jgi:hypothetical protein
MRRYYYKNVILFFIVWVVILTFYSSASAFSAACDSCLASCQGDPLCCTGIGCYCEDECSTGNCPLDQTEKWYCSLTGDCWVVGCECKTLGTPSLVNPAAGLTGVSISPALDWSDASNARSYDIRVCSDSACSSVAASSNVSVSQWQVSPVLNTSTTYWWQVRAKNSCRDGSWSVARSFTTICSSPSPPGTPSLLSPANGLTNVPINTTLDWSAVACASPYDVRVCSDSACSSVAASSNVLISQWQVSPVLNVSTTYWWQVRANNSYGNGAWSTAQSFTTSSDIPLSNGIPVNGSITGSASGNAWKYYYSDIPSGATNLVVDLYDLSADADLYVRYGSKPLFSTYNCRPYKDGILSEQCTTPSPLPGQLWIGINNYDTGTITYTVKVTWDDPVFTDVPSGYWADFNGDGATNVAAFHLPSDQSFTDYAGNLGQFGWGGSDSMPLIWDYDGDGKTDVSIYHIPTNQWFVKEVGNLGQFGWGGEESVPVPGDYNGDGRMERAFYHSPTNQWFVEGQDPVTFGWNGAECIPLPGDYDGDGKTDMVIYHLPSNQWFQYGVGNLGQFGWGGADCIPVPGDYNGDGKTEIAVYHVPTNQWFVKGIGNLGQYGWGGLESFPIPGDYNGDGVMELGFYRHGANQWFIEGESDFVWGWGGSDFMPITSQIAVYNWFRFILGRFQ